MISKVSYVPFYFVYCVLFTIKNIKYEGIIIYHFFFFIGLYNLIAQTTVTLIADYDAAIGYHDGFNTANINYGSAIQNAAYTLPGNSGPLNKNRAVIHFDLSSIPQNAIITSANLNLYALGSSGALNGHTGQNNSTHIKRITSPWSENTVTWNNQPPTTSVNEVTLASSTNPTQDYLNIDVKLLVQDMLNNNNGFLLKQVNEVITNALLFCSSDYSDPNKHPTLDVCYRLPSSIISYNQNLNDRFNVFPNPTANSLNIEYDTVNLNEEVLIELYTIDGKIVNSLINKRINTQINILNIESGIYFLKVTYDNNSSVERVIISH